MSVKDFLASPLSFMQGNVVLPGGFTAPGGTSGWYEMTMIASTRVGHDKKANSNCGVFGLDDGKWSGGEKFRAFWCHYSSDELHMQVVDNSADYMFTPVMDGCTFGIGTETSNGARMVGHVNVSRPSSDSAGFATQMKQQQDIMGAAIPSAALLEPSVYSPLGSGQKATTFGLRDRASGKWSFYTQIYTMDLTRATLIGFTQLL